MGEKLNSAVQELPQMLWGSPDATCFWMDNYRREEAKGVFNEPQSEEY